MDNSLVLLKNLGLLKNSSLTYSKESNAFLTQGYTSMAGNTYFNTLRLMEGIMIKEDVGQGYMYTFLNGIKLYDVSKKLLCERSYHCQVYRKSFIAYEIKNMIKNLLFEACKKDNISIDKYDAEAHIDKIVENALETDQRVVLNEYSQKHLTA
jgi:hypothetical protein